MPGNSKLDSGQIPEIELAENLSQYAIEQLIAKIRQGNSMYELGEVYTLSVEQNKGGRECSVQVIIANDLKTKGDGIFVLGEKIGEGGQGAVYMALNLITMGWVVVKRHSLYERVDYIEKEQQILQVLDRLVGVARIKPDQLLTLMEYVRGTNLLNVLYDEDKNVDLESIYRFSNKKELSLLKRAELALQAISQIIQFQNFGIVHRDVKTENFVAEIKARTDINTLVLVDVGSSYFYKTQKPAEVTSLSKTNFGSKGYTAPEMALDLSLRPPSTGKTDVFSLAIVIAEILTKINYQVALRQKLLDIESTEKGFARDRVCPKAS